MRLVLVKTPTVTEIPPARRLHIRSAAILKHILMLLGDGNGLQGYREPLYFGSATAFLVQLYV